MFIFTHKRLRKEPFWWDIIVEIASTVYLSYSTVYVNTYLAIATGEEPWQPYKTVEEAF